MNDEDLAAITKRAEDASTTNRLVVALVSAQDVPALVEEVRRLRAENKDLRDWNTW